uniref:transmembrane and ubiquitin-like domain-containing protein 1 n=1 Tax=Myxine glutinosa TaxID=7769 RepID=UPI00358E4D54
MAVAVTAVDDELMTWYLPGGEVGSLILAAALLTALILAWLSTYVDNTAEELFLAVSQQQNAISVDSFVGQASSESERPGTSERPSPAASLVHPQAEASTSEETDDGRHNPLSFVQCKSAGDLEQKGHHGDTQERQDVDCEESRVVSGVQESDSQGLLRLRKRPRHQPGASSRPCQERSMQLRLKFLNDTERVIQVMPGDTVDCLKRAHFPGQEEHVRFIYRGQLLREPERTLRSLGVPPDAVVHCHVSCRATNAPATSNAAPASPRLRRPSAPGYRLGPLLVPALVLLLCGALFVSGFARHSGPALTCAAILFGLLVYGVCCQ